MTKDTGAVNTAAFHQHYGTGGTAGLHHVQIPDHYAHEIPHADEERLEKLFKQLDRDGNGRIDIHDLSAALKEYGISHQYAEVKKCTFIQHLGTFNRNKIIFRMT